MSFKLGDVIIDEIIYGMALNLGTDAPEYVLTQLNSASINITADSTDVTDKKGNVVKRIYRAKQGEFSAQNAFINTNILAAASGTAPIFAENENIIVPMIMEQKAAATGTTTIDLKLDASTDDYTSVKVNQLFGDGTLGAAVAPTSVSEAGIVVLPAAGSGDAPSYIVRYDKTFKKDAVKVSSSINDFPTTVRMLFKFSYYDPCAKEELKFGIIECPNFMISPETEISLSADSQTMDINATLEVAYCDADKVLYNMYFFEEEDDD